MNRNLPCLLLLIAAAWLPGGTALAQAKTLASTLEVFVFPGAGQDATQQSKDEAECYEWAVGNTGNDPFDLAKQADNEEQLTAEQQQAAQQAGKGSGAKSAVRGAAAGAVIGEIADDDAGKGAAYGAAAGALRGRRQGRMAQEQAQQQVAEQDEQRTQATEEQLGNFKKAFSACLEAKNYVAKF